jgi:hypothetical protein
MEREKLETAAAKYTYLRGLFFIPLGAWAVLSALGNWQLGPLRHDWVFLLAMAAIAATCLPIKRFYDDHYGRLSPSLRQQVRALAALVVCAAVMFGGALLLRSRADWSLDLPVNAIAVAFSVVMLISYALGVGLKIHHVIIWGALLIVGALPVWTGEDPSNIGLLLAGVGVMITGVFDHRLFVRTFGSARLPALENGGI